MKLCASREILLGVFVVALLILLSVVNFGCNSNVENLPAFSGRSADCLPDIVLTDQNNRPVSLAALKGKPVFFDFIYTTCPGPCLVLTARMKAIADQLGPVLGTKAWFVSVTVDPEHDSAAALHAYAKEQGADRQGWLFLTGPPAAVDRVMAHFNLHRVREADGTIDHVLEFFLVGPDGHLMIQYLASDTNPAKIAGDIQEVIAGRQLAAR
ncbi:MAG TPA: SCO family protein [Candidatus Binataceae bacterium]|nr:SCO family protein [Candidatus Binataceae bacterium]